MTTFISIIVFILGAAVGSFLSVVVYRLSHKSKGIINGRSYCPHCKSKLKWRHMIPIISWIALSGRCNSCAKRISSHYLVMELITGLFFVAAFLQWNFLVPTTSTVSADVLTYVVDWANLEKFIFYIVEFSFLIAIFFYDLMHKEIPDQLSLPAIVIAITGGLLIGEPVWSSMLIGGLAIGGFFLLQFVLSQGKWIGGGDIRLGVLIGVLLGWQHGVLAVIFAYFIGALIGTILLLKKTVNRKSEIAFGPFLITGTALSLFYGERFLEWYFNFLMF